MIVSKTNWLGGINQLADITKLKQDEYWILINARVRKNAVEAVNLPLDVTNNLSVGGNIQDITAAGSLLVGFAGGQAFYKLTNGTWQLIPSFTMGSTAPRVFTALIPSSTVNFTRSVTSSTGTLTLGGAVGATPSALVVMDGTSQPWIIFPDGSSRVTGTYLTWSIGVPEYVPIANFPMFYNGVLYAVAAETLTPNEFTKRNQIVRSVTGAPLNFVVAVTPTGDKTSANESEGGALASLWSVLVLPGTVFLGSLRKNPG